MNQKTNRIVSAVALSFSVAVAAAHFVWVLCAGQPVDGQGFLFAALGYGLPIAVFALARNLLRKETPRWRISDSVFGGAFLVLYLSMAICVTAVGLSKGIYDAFYNLPLLYLCAFVCLGIAWGAVRMRPRADASAANKVLFALPLAALCAMIVHAAVLGAAEYMRFVSDSTLPATSAPWWTLPLLVAAIYLLAALVLFALYAVSRAVSRRRAV